METGQITIARANLHVTYPARFLLVAAMNPCRCGYLDDPGLACPRAPRCSQDYQARLSGPLLDRIDIHLDVPPVTMSDMALPVPREGTAEIAARVAAARAVQSQRLADAGAPALRTNSEADGEVLERVAPLDQAAGALLRRASEQLHLSARGYHRVLRVARTIADLDGAETIRKPHLAEAVSFRRMRPRR